MWRELNLSIKKQFNDFFQKNGNFVTKCHQMAPPPPQENPLVQHLPHNLLQRRDEERGCENASSSDSSTLV